MANSVASNGWAVAGVMSKTQIVGVKVGKVLEAVLSAASLPVAGLCNGYISRLFNYVERHNVALVVAAGFSATDWVFLAIDSLNQPTSYANYGNSAVDVAAPGGDSKVFLMGGMLSHHFGIKFKQCQTGK